MQKRPLGHSGIEVSTLCLGSMTWGSQNTEAEGHAQIDRALDAGINFIDTAEMYPVNPVRAETIGATESIIGNWLQKNRRRDEIVLASKVSGAGLRFVRDGAPISPASIDAALEGSLQRLQTDYIDLYQLHWPNRGSYHFRQNWYFNPLSQLEHDTKAHMQAVCEHLDALVKTGKIRAWGLSNESAWGSANWLNTADHNQYHRPVSIQNEYSMLCRLYDTDLAELSVNESMGLLAYSPLAVGLLTGKYNGDLTPEGSRRSLNSNLNQRITEKVWPALAAYQALADDYNIGLGQMALAWCISRPFMTSVIFGATDLAQLDAALLAHEQPLPEALLSAIDEVHRQHPLPF